MTTLPPDVGEVQGALGASPGYSSMGSGHRGVWGADGEVLL